MSDLERRWERLLASARRAPSTAGEALPSAWIERVARRGLLARAEQRTARPERLAWAGLGTVAAALAAAAMLWPGPILSTAESAAGRVLLLPRELPHAPRLPAAPLPQRPSLPPAEATLAALGRWPELPFAPPFTPSRTEHP